MAAGVDQPTQPWQVTRHHAAPTAVELQEARQKVEGRVSAPPKRPALPGSRLENRYAVQQQIITQQKKLLKEQQEQIVKLREAQSVKDLELVMERAAQLAQLSVLAGSRARSCSVEPTEQR